MRIPWPAALFSALVTPDAALARLPSSVDVGGLSEIGPSVLGNDLVLAAADAVMGSVLPVAST